MQALQADGYSVWWDEHIGTGDEWRQTIEQQLDAAKCVIVVWSKRSVGPDGQFVRDEATRAQQRRVYVPVTIDNVRVPLGVGERQATSLRDWRGDRSDAGYQAVLMAARRIAGEGSEKSSADSPPTPVSRRAVVIGGAVAAATVAGSGAWLLFKPGLAARSDRGLLWPRSGHALPRRYPFAFAWRAARGSGASFRSSAGEEESGLRIFLSYLVEALFGATS